MVKLALTGNMSTGGISIDRTFEAHPENVEIAEEAARMVGLDIAGIDFICPDITQPVRETGGAICEVNAAPGFRMHTHPTIGEPQFIAKPVVDLLFPPGSPSRVPIVAVTGTNGKTTTVELLGHLYRAAGEPVAVAGNVGTPLASLVGEIEPDATVVCEASSFQLEDTDLFAPECAVFLNLAPDHLDRHGTLEDYLAAKLRIFANQGNDDVAVFNEDEPALAGVDLGGCARRIGFCVGAGPDCEVSLAEGTIFYDGVALLPVSELGLFGEHNVANAMAAAAAALSMGLDREAVREGLRSFAGVPHRLEQVAGIGGVRFVNDSKATNVASATVGLRAFTGGVHAILGGSDKDEPFAPLIEPLRERAVAAYLVGATADRMAEELAPAVAAGVELHRCEDLEDAVRRAAAAAAPGEVVLLSPACASFDAFPDFEARGERFRQIVAALGGTE
jgi:UDP-N-acetylmuramoylalanine--D-glutamate ligase